MSEWLSLGTMGSTREYTPLNHSHPSFTETFGFPTNANPFHQQSTTILLPQSSQSLLFTTTSAEEFYQKATPNPDLETYRAFVFYLNVVLIPITVTLGLLGNLVSIAVLHKDRYNRVAVFLLQNLALANCFLLFMSLFVLTVSFGILNTLLEDYDYEVFPFIVVYVNPLGDISHSYVIWSTILLALNRYAAICKPFTSKNFLKLSSARLQVAVVVILSICFNLPKFFTYDIERYFCIWSRKELRCSDNRSSIGSEYTAEKVHLKYNFTLTTLGDNQHFKVYYQTIFYSFIMLVLPLILLIALHVPIIKQLQRSKRQMRHNYLAYDGKNEDNITVAVVVIIIGMAICHVMERICEVAKNLSGEEKSNIGLLYAQNISNFFVQFSSSTDFIVYYILKKRFRKEFWRKVHSCTGWQFSRHATLSERDSVVTEKRTSVPKQSLKGGPHPIQNQPKSTRSNLSAGKSNSNGDTRLSDESCHLVSKVDPAVVLLLSGGCVGEATSATVVEASNLKS